MKLLLQAPHRLFFFAAVVQLLAVSLWWTASLAARILGIPTLVAAGLEPHRAHALLMAYGFFPLFIFGFLLTAGPRWLEQPPPSPGEYVAPAAATSAGALLLLPALALDADAAAAAGLLYAMGWLWLLGRFVELIAASRAASRMHAVIAAGALTAGLFGLGAGVTWLGTGSASAANAMEIAGLWGFLVPLFCVVCHRMIPFLTCVVLPGVRPWKPSWTLTALVGGSVLHGLLEALGLRAATWIVDAPLALGALGLAWRWGLAQSFHERLLAMLHLGFLWLAFAYALFAVGSLSEMAGRGSLGLAPVHAMTIGFLASLTMAMVSRVSSGHSGRALAADRLTLVAFLLLQLAALTRVGADLWPGAYGSLLVVAALLWLACFAAWGWRYLPYYWRPRTDGKAG